MKHLVQNHDSENKTKQNKTIPWSRLFQNPELGEYKSFYQVTKGPEQDSKIDSTEPNIITVKTMLGTNLAIFVSSVLPLLEYHITSYL